MKTHCEIDISAPIEKVFAVFTDLEKAAERIDGIQDLKVLEGPSSMTVGTRWTETRMMFGKEATETMWVTELTPLKNYVVEAESHGTKYHSEYTFESTSEGTHVSMVFIGEPQTIGAKFMSIIFGFMTKSIKNMLYQDMSDLKRICEEDAVHLA